MTKARRGRVLSYSVVAVLSLVTFWTAILSHAWVYAGDLSPEQYELLLRGYNEQLSWIKWSVGVSTLTFIGAFTFLAKEILAEIRGLREEVRSMVR